MTPDEYQKKAMSFAAYGKNPMYAYLGLVEEIGEYSEKGTNPDTDVRSLVLEDGDCRWMVAAIAKENKISLSDVVEASKVESDEPQWGLDPAMSRIILFTALSFAAARLCGLTAKFIRKHEGFTPQKAARWTTMKADVAAYRVRALTLLGLVWRRLDTLADDLGFSPEESMQENIAKLTERRKAGVIAGSGETVAERLANAAQETDLALSVREVAIRKSLSQHQDETRKED